LILLEDNSVPKCGWHKHGGITSIERENSFIRAVVTANIDGAMDADYELRATTVRMIASVRSQRGRQRKHARNVKRHLCSGLRDDNRPIRARKTRQFNCAGVSNRK
jgi:hypothetical protein